MKPPRTCPDCGASLDAQEHCDCRKAPDVMELTEELRRKSDLLQEQIIGGIHKDAEIRRLTWELEAATQRAETAEANVQRLTLHSSPYAASKYTNGE